MGTSLCNEAPEPSVGAQPDLVSGQVIAVVVTRNRSALLRQCLEAIASQTKSVAETMVIDNASTDDTRSVVAEASRATSYVRLDQNLGGSMGFYEGIRCAYEKGYDWFWLMDDDLIPERDCLEKLTSSPLFLEPETGLLAAVVKTPEGKLEDRSRSRLMDIKSFRTLKVCDTPPAGHQPEPINCSAFLGLLVNRRAVEKVGLPIKDFFIAGDDVEYCIRIGKSGLKSYLVWDATVIHFSPTSKRLKKWLLPAYTHVPKASLWKVYCGYRNRAYTIARHCSQAALVREFVRLAIAILVYDDEKMRRLELLCRGFRHGVNGRLSLKDVRSLLPADN